MQRPWEFHETHNGALDILLHMDKPAVVLLLALGQAACHGSHSATPLTPTPVTPVPPFSATLRLFTDTASGFSTTDVRDAGGQIVQFNTSSELIWTADGTRLSGYPSSGTTIDAQRACQCWFEVRFGTVAAERRAYLTADYGHSNPGTLVHLEVVNGGLSMTQSGLFPPGSATMSGVITEATAVGPVPIEGAEVWRSYGTGWQVATTDTNGLYQIHGLYDGTWTVAVIRPGYDKVETVVSMRGDMRFDAQLVRR